MEKINARVLSHAAFLYSVLGYHLQKMTALLKKLRIKASVYRYRLNNSKDLCEISQAHHEYEAARQAVEEQQQQISKFREELERLTETIKRGHGGENLN